MFIRLIITTKCTPKLLHSMIFFRNRNKWIKVIQLQWQILVIYTYICVFFPKVVIYSEPQGEISCVPRRVWEPFQSEHV